MNDNGILAWHFLKGDGTTGNKNIQVEPGQILRVEGLLKLCNHGLHASRRALDALQYAPGPVVQRVVMRGEIIEDRDKLVASERECLWLADATRTLHEFALWCAEKALKLDPHPDQRSLNALEVKRRWLDGQASDQELDAARAAAWDAAGDAAGDAAWAAAWAAQNEKLETMLLALKLSA